MAIHIAKNKILKRREVGYCHGVWAAALSVRVHIVLCVCKRARGEKVSEKLRCSFSGWLLAGSARQLGETFAGCGLQS